MKALECKIPPPIVALLTAAMMWGIAKVAPAVEIGAGLRFALVALLATIGGIFAFSGFQAFGQAKTTISPINIEEASALVTTGIYRTTRNPMYLGLLMLLLAFAAYLAAPLALLGPLAFALFITRFQIIPEERVLSAKFGDAYRAYQAQVRRWL
jgi:protein-S-isoprenylcysteine O-methyltransferase Ste14